MSLRHRIITIFTVFLIGIILLGGIFSIILSARFIPTTSPDFSAKTDRTNEPPTLAVTPQSTDIVAWVNNEAISRESWDAKLVLEGTLNRLAGKAPPDPEVTLDRMVNQMIIIQSAVHPLEITDDQIQSYIAQLSSTWGMDSGELESILVMNGLPLEALENEVGLLLTVGSIVNQIEATQDSAAWIASKREAAQISILTKIEPSTSIGLSTEDQEEDPVLMAAETEATVPQPPLPSTQSELISEDSEPPSLPPDGQRETPTGVQPGQIAPDFTLQTPDGNAVTLSQYRGHVVVLNFWATWCPVCRQELSDLESAHQEYSEKGVVLLGVDQQEAPDVVASFMAQNGLSYPTVIDPQGAIGKIYQVIGIPTTIIIDQEGSVQTRHIGPITKNQFSDYIDPLLIESGSPNLMDLDPPTSDLLIAPDFTLPDSTGSPVTLSNFHGSSVVLVFYRGKT